ncbi:alpha/beta fold hydrolase [Micromonospora yangpuensis]|uniref:Pimeloyl-ACP methyl ester carboxylesterase n=1 Tax=Micromonospora yangpuensis TaxID=683228 RepID=A0A1C6UW31_9ACTN|nr:alpha/beta hydrolase [Micromonospora yangpuensis]GGM25577.1 hydrolase [Micromonospora yangpuensis]SCL58247.1 Pimeloyl-ACP methyl ester carboxylesterase [Micromonospora yangpuensis]
MVHHRFATVDGHRLFYREAGEASKPTIVLLHGYPTSSFMFRELIPRLAGDFHVIAPDHLGFGLSDAPSVEQFTYTFDALADLTNRLLAQLRVERYAIYVQDYGAPIGWRLALNNPSAITGIVTQNGNGYEAGFVPSFWDGVWEFHRDRNEKTEAGMSHAMSLEAIRWQYVHGVADPTLVDPTVWWHDFALVSRPGNDAVQLDLFYDYASNLPLYPKLHEYFRAHQPPLLAVWGEGDEIFGPAGARAFADDLPDAKIHLVPGGGHFLLETNLDEVSRLIREFLAGLPRR